MINADTGRPINYNGLTGSALLREGDATHSYAAVAIPAEPNLAARAPIATDIDPRTGTRLWVCRRRRRLFRRSPAPSRQTLEHRS